MEYCYEESLLSYMACLKLFKGMRKDIFFGIGFLNQEVIWLFKSGNKKEKGEVGKWLSEKKWCILFSFSVGSSTKITSLALLFTYLYSIFIFSIQKVSLNTKKIKTFFCRFHFHWKWIQWYFCKKKNSKFVLNFKLKSEKKKVDKKNLYQT